MGPNAGQTVAASIASAQSELSKLRNKFAGLGNTGDMPDFQPKQTKTMPLRKRLTYGFDMTTTKANNIIPSYTDFTVTIGVKLSDRFTAGIGAGYKMGWGADIRHIQLSSQGANVRSYIDMKIKKSFYFSGGMEANYLNAFKNIKELQNYSAWSLSALTGLGKTVSLKSKFFRATKVGILYDWLHAIRVPVTAPFVFRAGYSF
jgi:hypothetical protein